MEGDDKNGHLGPGDFDNANGGKRESRIDKYAKRSSQMFIPYSVDGIGTTYD